ncbi:hypothetical protein MBLNU457_5830t1 [Dothideomycetes sp. NU457]
MGNDGGSIPTRRELVKEAARNPTATEIKETQHEQQEYYWTTDPVSRKPLSHAIVSDSNGKLYNKETIIEYLIPSDDPAEKIEAEKILQGSVKSLKDIVEVRFEVDTSGPTKPGREVWKCPITNDVLGPGSKAAYLVPCGHAFSGSAIKEISGEKCLVCDTAYASNDVIPILPTNPTDIARLSLRAKTLKENGLTHSLKKASKEKKDKKRKVRDEAETDGAPSLIETKRERKDRDTERSRTGNTPTVAENAAIQNASTRALTEKVLAEQEARKKAKTGNENLKSLFSSRDQSRPIGKSADFMTRGYSIPANAKR